jgi:hypothetical protein
VITKHHEVVTDEEWVTSDEWSWADYFQID